MLSHELRTPLATIEAASSVLREVITPDRGARVSRLDKIQRSVARTRTLFDRHLGGPGMRDGWRLPRPQRFSLSELLGLFVVRRVAESHQGRVGRERFETGGNRFWMEIAAAPLRHWVRPLDSQRACPYRRGRLQQ